MTHVDRWLLPDGIDEILPDAAERTETMRRALVDLYRRWGYELVTPPMLEFTDSLLIGLGSDVDLMTFKVTDQISGRTLGIRADITPQIARMDAHSFKREGISRLCYAGHVVHTKPKNPLATRTPLQAGVELFGEPSLSADIEVVSLLLASLSTLELPKLHLDLAHVGIFRDVASVAGLTSEQEEHLFELLQRKAATEIQDWVKANVADPAFAEVFLNLASLAGSADILPAAKARFVELGAMKAADAVDELMAISEAVASRYPQAQLYFDLSELRGYHYHTGLVFAAYAPGLGHAIANGGRYDDIGEVFGRARAATGFTVDISAVMRVLKLKNQDASGIYAPAGTDWQEIERLRAEGQRVVHGFAGETPNFQELNCSHRLEQAGDGYKAVAI